MELVLSDAPMSLEDDQVYYVTLLVPVFARLLSKESGPFTKTASPPARSAGLVTLWYGRFLVSLQCDVLAVEARELCRSPANHLAPGESAKPEIHTFDKSYPLRRNKPSTPETPPLNLARYFILLPTHINPFHHGIASCEPREPNATPGTLSTTRQR